MFDTESLSDVTLRCDGKDIRCHRTILVLFSSVFDRMLQPNFLEGHSQLVTIEGIRHDVLKKAIHFMYGKGLILNNEDIMDCLALADMYDIAPLRDHCSEMLLKHINPTVAATLLHYAKLYNVTAMIKQCTAYCLRMFDDAKNPVAKTRGFLEVDKSIVIDLIGSFALSVAHEEDAFSALLDWVLFDADNRADDLPELLSKCIHLQNIPTQAVMDKVALVGNCCVAASSGNSRIVKHLLELSQRLAKGCFLPTPPCPRFVTTSVDVLRCCIYNGAHVFNISLCVSGPQKADLFRLLEPTKWPNVDAAIASAGIDRLYVFGPRQITYTQSSTGGDAEPRLEYRVQGQQNRQIFNMDKQQQAFCLHQASDGRLVSIAATDQQVHVKKLADNETWTRQYVTSTDLPGLAPYIHLSVCYASLLFVFMPDNDTVHVFNTLNGRFERSLSLDFDQHSTPCNFITSAGNLACLFHQQGVFVVRLDKLLELVILEREVMTAANAQPNKRRLDEASQLLDVDDESEAEILVDAVSGAIKYGDNPNYVLVGGDKDNSVYRRVRHSKRRAVGDNAAPRAVAPPPRKQRDWNGDGDHASVASSHVVMMNDEMRGCSGHSANTETDVNVNCSTRTCTIDNTLVVKHLRLRVLDAGQRYVSAAFYCNRLFIALAPITCKGLQLLSIDTQQLLLAMDATNGDKQLHAICYKSPPLGGAFARTFGQHPSANVRVQLFAGQQVFDERSVWASTAQAEQMRAYRKRPDSTPSQPSQ